ncbi:hypothetical protein SZ64_04615 [Erythrobacter sp. SG61-1L]|uniref:hypothetical protein n=1 Tax=Erythrobacter sp. SG61-1L TaxID=1603897 RepID=UPI0006C93472|nr:hypothetical protein [Erythrobacter sp. SG61-1L]KPL67448.1 hypothetical protein SZ64_04615 [Erythrobacter sp. SG61-1L]
MSSFIRRIQRQVMPSHKVHASRNWKGEVRLYANPARKKFFNGRGSKLGVSNPKDTALLARQAREAKRAAARKGKS